MAAAVLLGHRCSPFTLNDATFAGVPMLYAWVCVLCLFVQEIHAFDSLFLIYPFAVSVSCNLSAFYYYSKFARYTPERLHRTSCSMTFPYRLLPITNCCVRHCFHFELIGFLIHIESGLCLHLVRWIYLIYTERMESFLGIVRCVLLIAVGASSGFSRANTIVFSSRFAVLIRQIKTMIPKSLWIRCGISQSPQNVNEIPPKKQQRTARNKTKIPKQQELVWAENDATNEPMQKYNWQWNRRIYETVCRSNGKALPNETSE